MKNMWIWGVNSWVVTKHYAINSSWASLSRHLTVTSSQSLFFTMVILQLITSKFLCCLPWGSIYTGNVCAKETKCQLCIYRGYDSPLVALSTYIYTIYSRYVCNNISDIILATHIVANICHSWRDHWSPLYIRLHNIPVSVGFGHTLSINLDSVVFGLRSSILGAGA